MQHQKMWGLGFGDGPGLLAVICPNRPGAIQVLVYELRRILLPRTSVNKLKDSMFSGDADSPARAYDVLVTFLRKAWEGEFYGRAIYSSRHPQEWCEILECVEGTEPFYHARPPTSRPPRSRPPISRPPRSRPPRSQPPRSHPRRSHPPRSRPPRSLPLPGQPPKSRPPRSHPPSSQPLPGQLPRSQPPRSRPPRSQPPR